MTSTLEIETPDDEPVILMRHVVRAPREVVFRLMTDPEHLRHWWGPRELALVV